MTEQEFMAAVLDAFPNATVEQDNEGQLVVYTNLRYDDNRNLVEFEED